MRGSRSLALALASCLAGSCSPSPPTVILQLVPGPDIVSLDGFVRLQLVASRCDRLGLTLEEIPFRPDPDGAPPEPAVELDIVPGVPISLWIQAWIPCDGPCASDAQAAVGACTCVSADPPRQAIAADGCTDWIEVTEDVQVPITLTATAGLCPAPRAGCPS